MLRRFFKFKVISFVMGLSFILVLGGWIWSYFALKNITQPLILHFNSRIGINQIGDISDLGGVGFLGLVMVIVNFFIAFNLEERDWFLGKLTVAVTLFLSILIFVGFAAIINVN